MEDKIKGGMLMFKKILVAVDGSEYSFRAVKTAASLAEKYNCKVTLIYVVALATQNPGFAPEIGVIPDHVIDSLVKEGEKTLNKAVEEFTMGNIDTLIRTGHPAAEIIAEAAQGYDIIIVGSRGLGEFKSFVMGSVSDRVAHNAKCAIMIVH